MCIVVAAGCESQWLFTWSHMSKGILNIVISSEHPLCESVSIGGYWFPDLRVVFFIINSYK